MTIARLALLAVLTPTLAAAQVTVIKPNEPPQTIACPRGCRVEVTIPAPPDEEPPPCTFIVAPRTFSVGAGASVASVTVTPSRPGCGWAIFSGASWLTASVVDGRAEITIAANPSTVSRLDTLEIAGQTVTVTQAGAVPPDPPTTALFRANYADFPNLGFGASETRHLGVRFTREHLPTGGPRGEPAVRFAGIPCAGCSDFGGQFNWGNRGNLFPSDPGPTERRWYRWRMKFEGDNRGLAWGGGGSTGPQNKLLILGQDCGSSCRVILSTQTTPGTPGVRNFRIQLDGGGFTADTGSYPANQWLDVQLEIAPGANGSYRIWINNNAQGAPTAQRSGFALAARNHRYVWIGAFLNDGIAPGGSHGYVITGFEIGASFDPTWHRP